MTNENQTYQQTIISFQVFEVSWLACRVVVFSMRKRWSQRIMLFCPVAVTCGDGGGIGLGGEVPLVRKLGGCIFVILIPSCHYYLIIINRYVIRSCLSDGKGSVHCFKCSRNIDASSAKINPRFEEVHLAIPACDGRW